MSIPQELSSVVTSIVTALVDYTDEIHINAEETDNQIVFHVAVAEKDIGKLIGSHGRNAQAIRTLLSGIAAKSKRRILLDIMEP